MKREEIKKVILKILRHKWTPRENSHVVGMLIDAWAKEIEEIES